MRMRESRERLTLALEPLDQRVREQPRLDQLDRDRVREIAGLALAAIDRAHPATANPLDDPVRSDPLGRRRLDDLLGGGPGLERRRPIGRAHRGEPPGQFGSSGGLRFDPAVALVLGHGKHSLEQGDHGALGGGVGHRSIGFASASASHARAVCQRRLTVGSESPVTAPISVMVIPPK